MYSTNGHTTLSQLLSSIKEHLADAFPFPVWISAEVGEMKINNASGHCFLELIEKGGKNGIPSARANATIWRSTYATLSNYFFASTGQHFGPGLKVLLKVSVNYHELYGLSLQICDIDPSYTLGEQELQRLQTIARLKEDGVFDLNKELEMPVVLQRVAVVSSAGAAGYGDFMKELQASPYRIHTTLFQATVQGNGAEDSIIAALNKIAETENEFDCVAIIRGGGSQSDLSCFNSYEMCCNIAQFPLPIITGIGHDKDQSVADKVAAMSLKTPTAVAQYIVSTFTAFDAKITEVATMLDNLTTAYFATQKEWLQKAGLCLGRIATQSFRNLDKRLGAAQNSLNLLCHRTLEQHTVALARERELLAIRTEHLIDGLSLRIESAEKIIAGSSTEVVLARGFSIVRHQGSAVKDASNISSGDEVEITFSKGTKTAKIIGYGKEN